MNILTSHFPIKKSRTPSTADNNMHPTGRKTPVERPRSSSLISPACNSSDDSMMEIGWDNNSPSPSSSKRERRRRFGKQNDIASIIKKISKQKRGDYKEEKAQKENNDLLSHWVQENNHFEPTRSSRRSLTRRSTSQKQSKSNFSNELKRFLDGIKFAGGTKQQKVPARRSPRFQQQERTSSPIELLLENFDESVFQELDKLDKPPTILSKTPRLKRNFRVVTPRNNSTTGRSDTTPTGMKTDRPKCSLRLSLQKSGKNENTTESKEKACGNEIYLDAGLDEVISSQLDKPANNTTPVRPMLINFKDDDLDQLLLDIDQEEVKCKSQETSKVSSDQRKLKSRSNTSPFPLNKKLNRQLIHDSSIAFDTLTLNSPKSNNTEHSKSSDKKPCDTLTKPRSTGLYKRPSFSETSKDEPRSKTAKPDLFEAKAKTTLDCPKPKTTVESCLKPKTILENQNPKPKTAFECGKSSAFCSTQKPSTQRSLGMRSLQTLKKVPELSLNLSVISEKSAIVEDDFKGTTITSQRCSYSEIERKRKEAQLRLKRKRK